MSADHISDRSVLFSADDDTQNYYEAKRLCADSTDALELLLISLLSDARKTGSDTVEFWLDPQLQVTGYALEEIISAAISAANADPGTDAPLLRYVNRVYRTSMIGGGMTVQLFDEENENRLGET